MKTFYSKEELAEISPRPRPNHSSKNPYLRVHKHPPVKGYRDYVMESNMDKEDKQYSLECSENKILHWSNGDTMTVKK